MGLIDLKPVIDATTTSSDAMNRLAASIDRLTEILESRLEELRAGE